MQPSSKIEQPVLEGEHVRLEPLTREHLPVLEAIAFDSRIWRYMNARVETKNDLELWLEAALKAAATGTQLPWVTVLERENRVVGSTRFIDLDMQHRTVEIGHTWITPELHAAGVNRKRSCCS